MSLPAEGVGDHWWGVFDDNADVQHAHVIQGIDGPYANENVSIASIHASPDGTIYLEGWFAAWGPDGDVRWGGQAIAGDLLQVRSWDHPSGRAAFALQRGDETLCRAVLA